MSRARFLLAAAAADIAAGGALIAVTWGLSFWHGLYCAIGTATTVGCDTVPRDAPGWAAAVAVELTAIPLLAACFGQLHLDRVKTHMEDRLAEHHGRIHDRLDKIEREAK